MAGSRSGAGAGAAEAGLVEESGQRGTDGGAGKCSSSARLSESATIIFEELVGSEGDAEATGFSSGGLGSNNRGSFAAEEAAVGSAVGDDLGVNDFNDRGSLASPLGSNDRGSSAAEEATGTGVADVFAAEVAVGSEVGDAAGAIGTGVADFFGANDFGMLAAAFSIALRSAPKAALLTDARLEASVGG